MDNLESEPTGIFIPSWPMYLVSINNRDGTAALPTLKSEAGGVIPVFTEALLAERYRDACCPTATIRELANAAEYFRAAMLCDEHTDEVGFAIDPEDGARQTLVLFRDIRSQVMGDDPA